MQPPAILQVLPRLENGGVERGTIEIAQAIVKAGMRAIVASAGGVLVSQVAKVGATHITIPLDSKNPLVMWRNAYALSRLIAQEQVSIIHARSRAPAWSAAFAAGWNRIPMLTTFHGIYGTENAFKRRYNRIMARGARVIAVSQYVAEHVHAQYGVDPAIIRTIPRGVDFSIFDESRVLPNRLAELTRSWRLSEEFVPVIFCPGRITRIKGHHVLVEALAKLRELNFVCIIAGNDEGHEGYREEIEELIRQRALEGKVRICGPTSAMAEAYTLSRLVVVPSVKPESFGRVAIEAQAMGRIVIATDHGGARETIINHETGYLVPPGDADSLTDAIRFALTLDAEVIAAMEVYARGHVRQHFGAKAMQDATIAVYRELLA